MSALPARGVNSYRQTEIQSRSPLELVVMLYDGALRFTADARDAMVRRDIRARQQHLSRALAIVSELQSTLDMDTGGDVAEHLDKLCRICRGSADRRFGQAGTCNRSTKPVACSRRSGKGWLAISRASAQPPQVRSHGKCPRVPRCPHRAISSRPEGRLVILRKLEQPPRISGKPVPHRTSVRSIARPTSGTGSWRHSSTLKASSASFDRRCQARGKKRNTCLAMPKPWKYIARRLSSFPGFSIPMASRWTRLLRRSSRVARPRGPWNRGKRRSPLTGE